MATTWLMKLWSLYHKALVMMARAAGMPKVNENHVIIVLVVIPAAILFALAGQKCLSATELAANIAIRPSEGTASFIVCVPWLLAIC